MDNTYLTHVFRINNSKYKQAKIHYYIVYRICGEFEQR